MNITEDDIDIFKTNKIDSMYHEFLIPKRNGGYRTITAPNDYLKEIYLDHLVVSIYARGFVEGRSIVTNATKHLKQKEVYNIDLENFFPTITSKDVFLVFKHEFNIDNDTTRYLTNLCTYKRMLPQGAPTSPVLSNLVCRKMDKRFGGFAKANNLNYTRYADDITFSGDKITTFMRRVIKSIIKDEGFKVNKSKERLQKASNKQIVTGLIVNDKLSVNKQIIMKLKNAIYYCKKFGVYNHLETIDNNYSFYKEHIYGLAYYVKMIDKNKGEFYLNELDKILWPY